MKRGSAARKTSGIAFQSEAKRGSMCRTRTRFCAAMETTMKNANGSDSGRTAKGKQAKPRRTKTATPAAEVPTWAKSAEAGPLANATPEENHAPEAAFGTIPELPHRPVGTDGPATLKSIADGWLSDMRARGKTPATVKSYEGDLAIAMNFFDASRVAGAITAEEIAAYETSEMVTKTKSGKGKALPTVLKTRRALRLALAWAQKAGVIASLPYATAG